MPSKASERMSPEKRKIAILKVATEQFNQRGYEDVSITTVAREAKVTRALVYHYFPGKDQLLLEVLNQHSEHLMQITTIDPDLPPVTALKRTLENYLSYFRNSSGIIRDFLTPGAGRPSIADDLIANNHRLQIERFHKAFRLEPTPQSQLALASWLDFVVSVSRNWEASPRICLQSLVDMCVRAAFAALDISPEDYGV